MAAVALLVALAAFVSLWRVVHWHAGPRRVVLLSALVAFVLVPLVVPADPVLRCVLTILVAGVLPAKIVDILRSGEHWQSQSWGRWVEFSLNPIILVHRRHILEPRRSRAASARLLWIGLAQVVAGHVIGAAWVGSGWTTTSFWLDHAVKLVAVYLTTFNGGMVLTTGLLRLLGSNVLDLVRSPGLARTPADFWRRYNRNAGQFLSEHVFMPLGGHRAPSRAILLTFVINGLFHEYVGAMLAGRVTGYLLAFFVLQGLGVALTFRARLRGSVAHSVGIVSTLVFNYLTTILFFEAVDAGPGWYADGGLLP